MDNIRFQYLYQQYLNKRLDDKELQEWKAALSDPDYNNALHELTQQLWNRDDLPVPDYNRDQATVIYKEIVKVAEDNTNTVPAQQGKAKIIKLWLRVAAAAAVLTFIFGTSLFLYHTKLSKPDDPQQDITPGRNKATLTLANGKKISLTDSADGSIAYESGISISKTASGQLVYTVTESKQDTSILQYNTIEIPKGGQYQVRLPDGTVVWLNAASSLKYPISFSAAKQRKVELTGEGYFEVAKDKTHPFIVKISAQEVQVLGTHFNINGYNDEPAIKTTLLEGSVKVSSTAGSTILSPGQQAILKDHKLNVQQVNTEETIAWKNGYFRFNSESIESIMKKLSRWYNIEVSYEGNVKSKLFTGKISKFKNISQVLKMLGKTKVLNFKLEGRRVIISE